jgi:orotidine-5'-phosphate decarboxylase
MTRNELIGEIKKKSSFLCVGLDTGILNIPGHLKNVVDPVFEFNRAIIDATADLCIAYKINLAFYESRGPAGWESLKKTVDYIPGGLFRIGDGKRGDIGNTGEQYAASLFEYFGFDAATVAPYMGRDSVEPFLKYDQKWTVLLALTSNPGAADLQLTRLESGESLFEKVIRTSSGWAGSGRLMYVIGATQAGFLQAVRKIVPDHFLLIPGIGAQGGDLGSVARYGINSDIGLIVNASRSIIFASSGRDFHSAARAEAGRIREKMKSLMENQ